MRPPPFDTPAMVYDAARQRVVLFGGTSGYPSYSAEIWEWDGVTWSHPNPAVRPPGRRSPALTYDPVRGRVVLFGGIVGTSLHYGDTWEWDGSTWLQRNPASSPPPRAGHAMAWDRARQRAVLFGGRTTGSYLADTWEWDGATWIQRSSRSIPAPRASHAMAYHAGRGRIVLFAGTGTLSSLNDTWEWDGTAWTHIDPATSPLRRLGLAMAYDDHLDTVVAFGGLSQILPSSNSMLAADTWLYGSTASATTSPLGIGCGGASSAPVLLGFGRPSLGNTSFALDVVGAASTAPVAMLFSLGSANLSLGAGCTLYVDPGTYLLTLPMRTSAAGHAAAPIPIALDPSLVGARFHAQAAVADPSGPWLGLSLSEGLDVLVGN